MLEKFVSTHCSNTSVFDFKSKAECEPAGQDEGWYILGLTEHVGNKTKIPGGQNNEKEVGQPEKTARREFEEETGFRIEENPIQTGNIHLPDYDKYSYLSVNVVDVGEKYEFEKLKVGMERRVKEPDGRVLTIKWWSIEEFSKRLLLTHRGLFMMALKKQAELDPLFKEYLRNLKQASAQFCQDNLVMVQELFQEAA